MIFSVFVSFEPFVVNLFKSPQFHRAHPCSLPVKSARVQPGSFPWSAGSGRGLLIGWVCLIALAGAARAGEDIQFTPSASARLWLGAASNQAGRDYPNFGKNETPPNAAAIADFEADLAVAVALPSDVSLGGELDLSPEANQLTRFTRYRALRRAYANLTGDYGALSLGMRENAGKILHLAAPELTGMGGQDGNWWQALGVPAGHRGLQRTYAGDDQNSPKIVYLTPSVYGFTAGLSYTPRSDNNGVGFSPVIPRPGDDFLAYDLAYRQALGPVGLLRGDFGAGQSNNGALHFYQGGLRLSYAGWALGGSLLRREVANAAPLYKDLLGQGTAWDGGLSYGIGPYALAFNYFAERAAKGSTTDSFVLVNGASQLAALGSGGFAYDHDQVIALEGLYRISPRFSLSLTGLRANYADAYGVRAEQNRGWACLSGVTVRF